MSFQTCMSFFLMLNIKEDILKNAGYQTVDSSIDFHSIYFPTLDVSGDQQLFGSSKFFKWSSFVFNIRNKLKQVCNYHYSFKAHNLLLN